ncbi:AraC family transcriptional regulator [Agromyces sp. NPDC058110]|uniref:helix-turn-helix transcriptional regulator n=1 Tax=Agromyces sp. NPDC058110 TaxID=3346345 RepID=UPI0036DBB242
MCTIAHPRVGPASIDDARTIDDLIEHLRWSMLDFSHRRLRAGERRDESHESTRFHFVISGTVELEHDGSTSVIGCGDFALLPRGGRVQVRAAHDTILLSTSLALLGARPTLTRAMPAMLSSYGFRRQEPAFAALLDTMHREASDARPGAGAVIAGLTDVVVSAAVRFWLEHGCGTARPWLAAADDQSVGLALAAIHDDPGAPWTLESLARVAHASRSQFAEQFRLAVGETPARYVARIRMALAERMLRDGLPVSGIAFRLGYDSEAGFSRAFRRHRGVAPSLWRRTALQPVA